MNILTVGTSYIDIKGHPFDRFIPDGRNAGFIEYNHGGVARNIAEDIANLGVGSTFLSVIDNNGTGDDLMNHLKDRGIVTDFIKRSTGGCGTWLAVFDDKGNVFSSISGRPNLSTLPEHIESNHEKLFDGIDAIITEIDIDEEIVSALFKYGKLYNIPVYCAVATMSEANDQLKHLKDAELFICNEQEIGMLFDFDPEAVLENQSVTELINILNDKKQEYGLKQLVVTLGEKGAIYLDSGSGSCSNCCKNGEELPELSGICPAEKVEKVTDTTGAGDSFCAGLVSALTAGKTLKEACELGAKVSALVIQTSENVLPPDAITL